MRNERIFQAARAAQDRARKLRREAVEDGPKYGDKWKADTLARANRAYKEALLWLQISRPVNIGGQHE